MVKPKLQECNGECTSRMYNNKCCDIIYVLDHCLWLTEFRTCKESDMLVSSKTTVNYTRFKSGKIVSLGTVSIQIKRVAKTA